MDNPNQLISEDLQESKLPQLVQLLENPWFLHFVTKWKNAADNCMLGVKNLQVGSFGIALTREQIIGESRAYDICADGPKELYDRLVEQIQRKQKEQ